MKKIILVLSIAYCLPIGAIAQEKSAPAFYLGPEISFEKIQGLVSEPRTVFLNPGLHLEVQLKNPWAFSLLISHSSRLYKNSSIPISTEYGLINNLSSELNTYTREQLLTFEPFGLYQFSRQKWSLFGGIGSLIQIPSSVNSFRQIEYSDGFIESRSRIEKKQAHTSFGISSTLGCNIPITSIAFIKIRFGYRWCMNPNLPNYELPNWDADKTQYHAFSVGGGVSFRIN
ncbi:MAG: hypothetical protein R2792_02195 [Saprospiraceae bacterium]